MQIAEVKWNDAGARLAHHTFHQIVWARYIHVLGMIRPSIQRTGRVVHKDSPPRGLVGKNAT